jgi:hypothetical protein
MIRKRVDGVPKPSSNLILPPYPSSSTVNGMVESYSLEAGQFVPGEKTKCLSSEMQSLPSANENTHARRLGHSDKIPMDYRPSPRIVQTGGVTSRSPSLRKIPSIGTTCLSSSSSNCLGQSSYASSRTFSPPPFPSQADCTTLPEVVQPVRTKSSRPMSILSDGTSGASSKSRVSSRNLERKPKWSLFKSSRGATNASLTPSTAFFTSGRTLLIWSELGSGCYELDTMPSTSFRIVTTGEVLIAAGGTRKCAAVNKTGSVILPGRQ